MEEGWPVLLLPVTPMFPQETPRRDNKCLPTGLASTPSLADAGCSLSSSESPVGSPPLHSFSDQGDLIPALAHPLLLAKTASWVQCWLVPTWPQGKLTSPFQAEMWDLGAALLAGLLPSSCPSKPERLGK